MKNLFNEVNRKSTDAIKWDYQERKDNIPFWIADSDYGTAPCVLKAIEETSKHSVYGYNKVPIEFNEAVVNWYQKRYKCKLDANWVIPSTGVILELRVLIDLITKVNEGVILQTPVYHTFHRLLKGMQRRIVENKLIKVDDTYIIDYENLEKLFKDGHKVLILCSPHNPIGRIWNYDEIERIITIAKKYQAFVIIDEYIVI